MIEQIAAHGARRVAEARDARLQAWDEAIRAALPKARVERDEDALTVTGQDLLRRWLGDSRLRFPPGARA